MKLINLNELLKKEYLKLNLNDFMNLHIDYRRTDDYYRIIIAIAYNIIKNLNRFLLI